MSINVLSLYIELRFFLKRKNLKYSAFFPKAKIFLFRGEKEESREKGNKKKKKASN